MALFCCCYSVPSIVIWERGNNITSSHRRYRTADIATERLWHHRIVLFLRSMSRKLVFTQPRLTPVLSSRPNSPDPRAISGVSQLARRTLPMWHFAYSCHKLLLRIIGFRDTACWSTNWPSRVNICPTTSTANSKRIPGAAASNTDSCGCAATSSTGTNSI